MKNNLLKLYMLVFLLASDFVVFAQPDEDEDGSVEGGDPPAPINGKLLILVLIGISFAFYYFSQRRKKQLA